MFAAIIISVFAAVTILAAVGFSLRSEAGQTGWTLRSAVDDMRYAGSVLGAGEHYRLGGMARNHMTTR
ncbi:hypothetical protein [Gephyromycinifex aptenodytis]|uniref:hypothetical protein n=1 Tax=Gephyromycinifex aptenodytis TaxID=2716227 RepID=UPI00144517A3|nr:hypothetical protein [Gephyromycinifex aptenodytis]